MSLKITPNFLNKPQCDWLINFHTKYFPTHGVDFEGRQLININTVIDKLAQNAVFDESDPLKILTYCIDTEIRSIAPKTFINYHQIVKWPAGEWQPEHKDFDYHTWTSIIYLNDDIEGGETVVGKQRITPEQGKMITFSGSQTEHQVLPVIKGNRYTVADWYKTYS